MGSATAPFQFTYTGIIIICITTTVTAGHEVPFFAVPADDPVLVWFYSKQQYRRRRETPGKKPLHHTLTVAHINPVFDVNFRMDHC
jgi:hypothetical protein